VQSITEVPAGTPIIPFKSKADLPAAKLAIEKATILLGLPFELIEVVILAPGAGG
jgi:hypothetical protein